MKKISIMVWFYVFVTDGTFLFIDANFNTNTRENNYTNSDVASFDYSI
jgi:hypothetical protein